MQDVRDSVRLCSHHLSLTYRLNNIEKRSDPGSRHNSPGTSMCHVTPRQIKQTETLVFDFVERAGLWRRSMKGKDPPTLPQTHTYMIVLVFKVTRVSGFNTEVTFVSLLCAVHVLSVSCRLEAFSSLKLQINGGWLVPHSFHYLGWETRFATSPGSMSFLQCKLLVDRVKMLSA